MSIKILNDESLSKVTKKVVNDFNTMSDKELFRKYSVSKHKYLKRFMKYGDPYMNAPLAKFGKFVKRLTGK